MQLNANQHPINCICRTCQPGIVHDEPISHKCPCPTCVEFNQYILELEAKGY